MTVRWVLALASAGAFFCAFALGSARADEMESNINRPGGDYKDFPMEATIGGFASCKSSCEWDEKCKAWTFVRSGVQGPKAHCWLKSSVPIAKKDNCCTSGLPVRAHGCEIGGKVRMDVLDRDCDEAKRTGCIQRLLNEAGYKKCLRAQPVRSSGCVIAGVKRFNIDDRDCREAQETGCIKRLLTNQEYEDCKKAQIAAKKSPPPPPPPGGGTPAEWVEMLQAHNAYRAMHGSPALTWSSTLAQGAEDWAKACTPDPKNPDRFAHSGFDKGYGENLFWGGSATSKAAADWWYAEIRNYDWNNPIGSYFAGDTDSNKEVRHFTQLVWKATTTLGCGVATCTGKRYYVCRYQPQGNFNGDKPGVLDANVPRKR
jgi:uncharacterized protein YkwD